MARSPIVSTRQLENFELSDFFIVQSCGFSAHLKVVTDEHDEIIAALSTRNAEAAKKAAMDHIESVPDLPGACSPIESRLRLSHRSMLCRQAGGRSEQLLRVSGLHHPGRLCILENRPLTGQENVFTAQCQ